MTYNNITSYSTYAEGWESLVEYVEADYSWAGFGIFRNIETGQLGWATDSGCSCYGFGDNIKTEDIKPVATWQDAVAAMLVEDEEYPRFSEHDRANLAARLMPHPMDLSDVTDTIYLSF